MQREKYRVMRRNDGRYIIADAITQAVIDDTNSYETPQDAEQAVLDQCQSDKAMQAAEKLEATAFWQQHGAFGNAIRDYYKMWIKEITRGEIDPGEDLAELAEEMAVEGFKEYYIEYLT